MKTNQVNEDKEPTGDGARSERQGGATPGHSQPRDLELTPPSILHDIQAWLSFRLDSGVRHKAGMVGPTYTDGYSYVEIPEWEARQKLDNVRAALALVDGPQNQETK